MKRISYFLTALIVLSPCINFCEKPFSQYHEDETTDEQKEAKSKKNQLINIPKTAGQVAIVSLIGTGLVKLQGAISHNIKNDKETDETKKTPRESYVIPALCLAVGAAAGLCFFFAPRD